VAAGLVRWEGGRSSDQIAEACVAQLRCAEWRIHECEARPAGNPGAASSESRFARTRCWLPCSFARRVKVGKWIRFRVAPPAMSAWCGVLRCVRAIGSPSRRRLNHQPDQANLNETQSASGPHRPVIS